ncbi:MAG: amidohydrolase family protein, partial [Chromatiales bacterium]|nr:amidohydrolase family protein [Chromatiales bacterium]
CVISHHKACGRANWGKTEESLARIDKANRDGQAVDFDVYPYTASSTVLLAHFVERAEKVLITWSTPHPEVAGEELTGIAERWKCSIDDAVVKLQPAGAIYFQMDEADLRRVLRHPGSMVGSDGIPHDEHPHPRLWGTFPRVLGHYARDEGLFSMEEAVYKMTGLTARVFGLKDRGNIAPGYFADLVLFNQDEVIDRADFLAPTTPSAGIERVMVNGQTVWQDGAPSGKRPGGVLRRE